MKHRFHYQTPTESYRSLDLHDDRGREIGAIILVRTAKVVENTRDYDDRRANALPLGAEIVGVVVHATRNRARFGASQALKHIGPPGPGTDAKVDAEIERRIASMTKRYRKQGCAS